MLYLNTEELYFSTEFQKLKNKSGLHSPSMFDIKENFPHVNIAIDACFLSNPYAFDYCFKHIKNFDLENLIKYYPPQNYNIAKYIAHFRGISPNNIIVGNGAIEIIENYIRCIIGKKIIIPVPTFSEYYELSSFQNQIFLYMLDKEKNFQINVENLVAYINNIKADYVFLVNPSNPSGTHLSIEDLKRLHENLNRDQILVIDESFIDFATDSRSLEPYVENHENLIIIRSLSKDLGIAGIRLGYGVFPRKIKDEIMRAGFLWNSNGMAYEFVKLLNDPKFTATYKEIKEKYIRVRDHFYLHLKDIPHLKVYPSHANFFLIETLFDPYDLFIKLLMNHGIYVRILTDRIGLKGHFLRIACKTHEENSIIAKAIALEVNKNVDYFQNH